MEEGKENAKPDQPSTSEEHQKEVPANGSVTRAYPTEQIQSNRTQTESVSPSADDQQIDHKSTKELAPTAKKKSNLTPSELASEKTENRSTEIRPITTDRGTDARMPHPESSASESSKTNKNPSEVGLLGGDSRSEEENSGNSIPSTENSRRKEPPTADQKPSEVGLLGGDSQSEEEDSSKSIPSTENSRRKDSPTSDNTSVDKTSISPDELDSTSKKNPESTALGSDKNPPDAMQDAPRNPKKIEDPDDEIDNENAEDAEDTDNRRRHSIPILDYEAMSMENLVGELQKLVRNEKVQAIKKQVDSIKYEFDQKFDDFLEGKKEKFIESGGNEIDFRYNSNTKRQFNEVYKDYREKREQYYKNREKNLKENLSERLAIIEELKGLTGTEEDMGSTYKTFKNLQEKWRKVGPIPKDSYNNTWRNYRHHVEIFYDFLHLNREMRDLDFKHNLEEKEKLVQRAEALANEPDINRVFRELQALHKLWKEEIGPVGQEHREEIWERFSKATKVLHQKRQQHYQELEKTYEQNLADKEKIIISIAQLADDIAGNHRALQKQMKRLEELRTAFFAAGKVPRNKNKATWTSFKDAVRGFNRKKNTFYKNLKQEQQENLDKKRELLQLAVSLQKSEDFDIATPEMKRIQAEWKTIGHVPRKYSDKIWKDFKKACNHYFDRLHALKNKGREEEEANFDKKTSYLEKLAAFEPSGDREKDLKAVKSHIETWKSLGRVPLKKKNIDQKFNKTLDGLLRKMNVGRKEAELLKYGNTIQRLADSDNDRAIEKERGFIRKKIEETQGEIRQLENNLQFFSNASEDNPMVREVVKKVDAHKESLAVWKAKLKKLNIMQNQLDREAEDGETISDVANPETSGPEALKPEV